ncbi:unnamed protein product [Paramecium pentaurelia]|uniref:Uncharacterized protein n=1 Tax=Paramecium pentaurelia TaxID=43138 RepID=A0A8S1UNW7_9CILI|nr:unnamed protein product [Paramecium pentaurelia]
MYQITKQMVDFRRNQFLNQGLQTEFTIQSENGNKLVSVGSQLKNLNNIEKHRYLKLDSSFEESSGESSVMCDQFQQKFLSIEEVQQMVIDTSINQAIKLEPKALQKNNRVGLEWESQKSIIIMNVDEQAINEIDLYDIHFYELRFKDKSFIQFKKIWIGSYEGKLAIIIRMKEDKSAQYLYYNLVTSTHKYKKVFGEQIEVSLFINTQYFQLKVIEKLPNNNEISVIMRFFPIQFNNEKLLSLQDMRAEQLFIYQGYKYGIFKTNDFEKAENYKKQLISKKYQEAHISILGKKKQSNLNYKAFFEDDCFNPRFQLEQKIGMPLSPPKITPQNIIRQQEQQLITVAVIQPTISAIKISEQESSSKEYKQSEVKPKPVEKMEQKIIAKPIQLKPVAIQIERERSSRKK